jgi:atypical dual specificity phosphatase
MQVQQRPAPGKRAFIANFITKYGNVEADVDESEMQQFQKACVNMKMTLSDGVPCVIEGVPYLLVGSVGSAYNVENLQAAGITHVLNVTNSLHNRYPENFAYLRIPLEDHPDADISVHFDSCLQFINTAKDSGGKCLVHCYQGISRSVTVVCAYLIAHLRIDATAALEVVRRTRPTAGPNSGFLRALRTFESTLKQP